MASTQTAEMQNKLKAALPLKSRDHGMSRLY